MDRVFGRQFGLPAGPQIVKQLRPGRQAGTLDDAKHTGTEVLARVAVVADDVNRALRRLLERRLEVWSQLREQRNPSSFVSFMSFSLGAGHPEAITLPINVLPTKRKRLGRSSDPALS